MGDDGAALVELHHVEVFRLRVGGEVRDGRAAWPHRVVGDERPRGEQGVAAGAEGGGQWGAIGAP